MGKEWINFVIYHFMSGLDLKKLLLTDYVPTIDKKAAEIQKGLITGRNRNTKDL